jgi:hypothetical protein
MNILIVNPSVIPALLYGVLLLHRSEDASCEGIASLIT